MKVLFVYSLEDIVDPLKPMENMGEIQFGLSYLSAVLKKNGHDTKVAVVSEPMLKRKAGLLEGMIEEFRPGAVCFTAVATQYPLISAAAGLVKKSFPDVYTVIGGVHATLEPESVIRDDFDALCAGEGEYPLLELIRCLEKQAEPSGIPNFWIKRGEIIERNGPRPFLENIDELPFPDREMWLPWIGVKKESIAFFTVLAGRGCPYQCTYCCNHALKKTAPGRYVRFRSPESISDEIRQITSVYPGATDVFLEVETMAANKKWALDVCGRLRELNATLEKPVQFGTNIRVTRNPDFGELFEGFRSANFKRINIGLESGSERVRRDVLKRDYSNRDVIETVALAREKGLKVCFFNLIGVPGETAADFKETVRINRECLPNLHYNSIFYPYPGTDLHALCLEKNLLPGNLNTGLERRKAFLDLPGFSRRRIMRGYIWFDFLAFRGKRPLLKVLGRVFMAWLRTRYTLYSIYRKLIRLPALKRVWTKMRSY
jgi:radical SAM superfamily enzyme YgiQ (UPF0313 family)